MKTLKSIFFLCLAFCILCLKVNAQIVYTDVNPDNTICTTSPCLSSFNLDLNNDGTIDYLISCTHTSPQCGGFLSPRSSVKITAYNNNTVAISTYPLAMNSGEIISSILTWASSGTLRYVSAGFGGGVCNLSSGNWINSTEHYLGLKLVVGTTNYYGWVRMQVIVGASTASCTIKDYAYNSTAGQSILAGQTCSPQATIKANGPLSFCSGGSVVLTSKNSGNTLKYQWKKNNVNINGATNKNYTATTAGDYKVKVTDTINNCYKTSGIKTVTVPCRESNSTFTETLEHLLVYPNPATNSITIKFPSAEEGEIQIINLYGQIVYSEKINSDETQIDVSKFSEGMYIVRWSNGENFETKTFSIIK